MNHPHGDLPFDRDSSPKAGIVARAPWTATLECGGIYLVLNSNTLSIRDGALSRLDY